MKIYVGNLTAKTTKEELRDTFTPYGPVNRVALMMDKKTGAPRGFGYVEMAQAEGERAIAELHGSMLGDQPLKVKEARPRSAREGEHSADRN